jgi:endonuclease III
MAKANPQKQRARRALKALARLYPEPKTALHYENPVQLLVAVILSAQCTDARVNIVTPVLFARFPDAKSLASADRQELESLIKSTGFFHNKAKHIQACCKAIVEQFGGQIPQSLDELVKLPGIGRKTANVVLGDAFGIPGVTVDTHVGRLSRRIGLSVHTDPVKVELDLMNLIPQADWTRFSHLLILHGRQICHARNPKCEECVIRSFCPKIGVPKS